MNDPNDDYYQKESLRPFQDYSVIDEFPSWASLGMSAYGGSWLLGREGFGSRMSSTGWVHGKLIRYVVRKRKKNLRSKAAVVINSVGTKTVNIGQYYEDSKELTSCRGND